MSTGPKLIVDVPDTGQDIQPDLTTLEDVERHHILQILKQTKWRISGDNGAAKILGIKPTTLHARLKKLGISRPA
jgi:transcriptional regulator of acetoin/glycerol metabolism